MDVTVPDTVTHPSSADDSTQPPLLQMRAITKSFPGVQALRKTDNDQPTVPD